MGEEPPHRREGHIPVLGVHVVDKRGLQELLLPVAQFLLPAGVHPLQAPFPIDQAEKVLAPLKELVQLTPFRGRKVFGATHFPFLFSQEEDPGRRSLLLRKGVVPPEGEGFPSLGHCRGFESLLGGGLPPQPQEADETLTLTLGEEKFQRVSPQNLRPSQPKSFWAARFHRTTLPPPSSSSQETRAKGDADSPINA